MNDGTIIIRSLKYDGRLHREWRARLLRAEGTLVVVEGEFEETVEHSQLGIIERGTVSTEYFWTDRWHSVFRFGDPCGRLRNYYCNVNRPASFDGQLLTFVDLDIDVLVAPDQTFRVLDEDEFASNAARGDYPRELREQVPRALAELIDLIERRDFPFDDKHKDAS
jgi:protein associated with RNAse G/E